MEFRLEFVRGHGLSYVTTSRQKSGDRQPMNAKLQTPFRLRRPLPALPLHPQLSGDDRC